MTDRIERAMQEAAEERMLDFNAQVEMGDNRVIIDTRISRDPSKSNNGGDYYFWEELWPSIQGGTLMQSFASCDFWQPEQEPEHFNVAWEDIVGIVEQSAQRHRVPIIRA